MCLKPARINFHTSSSIKMRVVDQTAHAQCNGSTSLYSWHVAAAAINFGLKCLQPFQGLVTFIFPKSRLLRGRSSKWFTQEIRHLINKIHTQRRRLLKNNSFHRNLLILSLELELEQKISSARLAYLQEAVASFSDNPRKLYDHLKHLSKGDQIPLTIIHNSSQITDAAVQAKLFNEHFHSVYTTSNYTLPP